MPLCAAAGGLCKYRFFHDFFMTFPKGSGIGRKGVTGEESLKMERFWSIPGRQSVLHLPNQLLYNILPLPLPPTVIRESERRCALL